MKKISSAVLVLLIVVGAWAEDKRFSLPIDDSPLLGPSDAPVTIIEFIDFQ